MKLSQSVVIGALMIGCVIGASAMWLIPTREAHAQGNKQLQAQVTAMIEVPVLGKMYRFEDPEYKVVCYLSGGGAQFSCVKK